LHYYELFGKNLLGQNFTFSYFLAKIALFSDLSRTFRDALYNTVQTCFISAITQVGRGGGGGARGGKPGGGWGMQTEKFQNNP